jgi:hypothetical protein
LVARTNGLARWARDGRLGDLRIDFETGPAIARLLMNSYNSLASSESYLVPAVIDRLDTLRALLSGGPTPFVAICTMNSLSVAPTVQPSISCCSRWRVG